MNRLDRALAALAGVAVALLSAAACLRRIWATDFWWQYATGRFVAEHGWPTVDGFSYTAAGRPWIEMRWLYCLAQFETMRHLGPAALVVGKWLVVAGAFALVALPWARRAGAAATSALVAVAILASSERLLVRPELVGWLFFAAFLFLLERRRRGAVRSIWLLPLLQLVWVNAHPSFVFGPLLVGLAAAALAVPAVARGGAVPWRALRPLALVFAGTLVACAFNPYGVRGMLVPLAQFAQIRASAYKDVIGEYQGAFAFGFAHTAVRYYTLLIALALVSAAANLRRLDPFWLVLCASQLYLSAIAIRNVPLFALAAVPFVLSNLARSPAAAAASPRALRIARRTVATLVVAGCAWYLRDLATDRFSVRQDDSKQAGLGLSTERYPIDAVDFLDRNGLDGRCYATLLESSYLTARGRQVFADPRGDVYDDALFRRYLGIQKDPAAWRAAVADYDIRIALAALGSPFVDVLARDERFELAFFDAVAAVYLRADATRGVAPIATGTDFDRVLGRVLSDLPAARPWSTAGPFQRVRSPKPYLDLSGFALRYGRLDAATTLLEEAAEAWPHPRRMPHRRAAIAEARRDWSELLVQSRAALAETPEDPQAWFGAGEAAFHLGRTDEALDALRRVLDLRPADRRALDLLARAEAIARLEAALAIAPGDADLLRQLADLRRDAGGP